MVNTLSTALTVITFFAAFALVFFILGLFLTKKFNYKLRKFYSIFFGLSFREVVVQACIICNLLLGLFFIYDIKSINSFGLIMIAAVNLILIIVSLNMHTILANIIYSSISISLLWLLSIVYEYYVYMESDTILYLIIAFIFLIILYYIFVTIRMIGILINNHQKILKG